MAWLEPWLTVPATDPDAARRRRLLNLLLLGFAALGSLLLAIVMIHTLSPNDAYRADARRLTLSALLVLSGVALAYVINRRWSGEVAVVAAVVGGYYAVRRLNAQVRVWNAQAAHAEALALEFSLGPDGQEVARLIPGPDGHPLLVKPGVVTQPVTRLEPDAPASERLQALAILGQALRGAGSSAEEVQQLRAEQAG